MTGRLVSIEVKERRRISRLLLDELADAYAEAHDKPNHPRTKVYEAEFLRRQTKAVIDNARYVLVTVIVTCVAAFLGIVFK